MKIKTVEGNFYKQSFRILAILVALILGIRFTAGFLSVVVVLVGIGAALGNRRGLALAIYLLLPFFLTMNPLILPGTAVLGLSARIGGVLMVLSLMLASTRVGGTQTLPLGSIVVVMLCAVASSIMGYFPLISYMKILNCVIFFLGLYYGTKNIHHNPHDVYLLRKVFFSFAIIVVLGSLATLPFPGIAYYTSVGSLARHEGLVVAADYLRSRESFNLFTGVLNHSQFLAPMTSCVVGWVFCDMIVVERRFRWLHALMISVAPVILFMTRSRAGLVSFLAMLVMVFAYCMPRLRLSSPLKGRLRGFLIMGVVLLFFGAGVAEVRNHSISRWLRKTDDVSGDRRSISEAVTASRMGKIEESLHDFKKNPIFGTGFQVIPEHKMWYRMGAISIFAAPLERGFIFSAVLGEMGIVGFGAFLFFLLSFWYGCAKKGYFVTWSLFVVYLSTNLAEMTFFSPGGGGGIMWLVTVIGGFVIDLAAKGKVSVAQMQFMPPLEFFQQNENSPRRK